MTTATESEEVEQYVRQYPEIAAELDAIQGALEKLAASDARSPRPEFEAELLAKLDPPAPPTKGKSSGSTSWGPWLLVALLLALVAFQFFRYQQLQKELSTSQGELEQLKKDCETLRDTTTTLLQYANIVGDPSSEAVQLKGLDIAPAALASVYWNANKKTSFLEIKNLPQTPSGKQYQLWAIVAGAPVDMGVFDLDTTPGKLQAVPFIENPQAFAVTLENAGGSPTPTLDQMYVLGNKS